MVLGVTESWVPGLTPNNYVILGKSLNLPDIRFPWVTKGGVLNLSCYRESNEIKLGVQQIVAIISRKRNWRLREVY